jgi:hypothetical protein
LRSAAASACPPILSPTATSLAGSLAGPATVAGRRPTETATWSQPLLWVAGKPACFSPRRYAPSGSVYADALFRAGS